MTSATVRAARGAAASLGAALVCTASLAGAVQSAVPVLIRTYNTYGVPAAELGDATAQASRLLDEAGVSAAWRDCRTARGPSSTSAPCDDLPRASELILRIVPAPTVHGTDIPLGEAHLDASTGAGALATIFGNRVSALAAEAGVTRSLLLGRVFAHEIGHLLLGATSHTSDGLMRAHWPVERLRLGLDRDWRFTAADSERIRAMVSTRALRADARSAIGPRAAHLR